MNMLYGAVNEAYKAVRGQESYRRSKELFEAKTIELFAVRNQYAAFQVLLMGDADFLLSVTDAACFGAEGLIDQVRLSISFSGSDNLHAAMNVIGFIEDDDRMYKADILLEDEHVSVPKDQVQPVWVEFDIPEDVEARTYEGRIEIFRHRGFQPEEKTGEVGFVLHVSDVTLPTPSKYKFHLDLWQHNSNIARKHEVRLWSEEHFKIMDQYIRSLSKLGQKAVTVMASEIPWSGQFCYRNQLYPSNLFEYNMIGVEKNLDGKLELDFSVVDRYIDLCFMHGIDSEIEVFGLINIWMCEEEGFGKVINDFSDGIRVRYLDRASNCFRYIDCIEDLIFYIQAIERHFISKGLIEKVRIVADEPADVDEYRRRLEFLKSIAPSFRYKAALNHAEFIRQFGPEIDDFVPIFTAVCEEFDKISHLKDEITGRLYWYVCCAPDIPNTFIKSCLLESWAIGILTEYMGLDGFLRWNYTVWPEKPRERMSYRYPFWKAGDMNFVYPSSNGGPLLTLRYKALLKGIQFYELMQMLKDKNPQALNILQRVYEKLFKFKSIKEFHYSMHKEIAELISLEYEDYIEAERMIADGISGAGLTMDE